MYDVICDMVVPSHALAWYRVRGKRGYGHWWVARCRGTFGSVTDY